MLKNTLSLPLDESGQRRWPAINVAAERMLVAASCSAGAVVRVPEVQGTFHQGTLVSGSVQKAQKKARTEVRAFWSNKLTPGSAPGFQ
ncbi:hypothetical protein [Erwinia psidii]|uniref:Uncharacterized protein n=1 Tax=Erwinia psidii TaxID=69224 RepID=A0A3N6S3E1_9GAMM|nr:hypothetical protein [Erwinia psidii]MCX8956839.1 hypothetical protein [Erwinia psidii]MCX8960350.1 hypothetical protein [Erwinia psidii]MCX8964470.1 hypothetical protein [Erwinia psidii]RQM40158.1 hypothetical protein EB241_02405 [Erwinia psidii]